LQKDAKTQAILLRQLLPALSVKMNYDEYIEEVRKYSNDEVVARLVSHLDKWKSDNANVVELADSIERFFGNSWITSEETHSNLYRLWSSFKTQAISGIGGMTMNERLYWFGLFERFENASESEQKVIYEKLCATT
jgi:hypothetical protein